jgi:hypothetical protein
MSEKTRAETELLETLRRTIRGKMNDVTDAMATNSCHDFADYKHHTGIIQGLALAERELLDLDEMVTRQ